MELIFVWTQCIYPSMTYLCKRPLRLGFLQATGAHQAYPSRVASCCGFVHTEKRPSELGISMWARGSKNISPWFSRFISDSITLDMLLESDGNFGEVINGTDICLDSMHLPLFDILVQAPSRAGFCTGNWSSLSLPIQTCIILWVCSYWEMSVCLSVRLSVCLLHLFLLCSHHPMTMKFYELLPVTKAISIQKAKVRGQRSRSKRSRPNLAVSGL